MDYGNLELSIPCQGDEESKEFFGRINLIYGAEVFSTSFQYAGVEKSSCLAESESVNLHPVPETRRRVFRPSGTPLQKGC